MANEDSKKPADEEEDLEEKDAADEEPDEETSAEAEGEDEGEVEEDEEEEDEAAPAKAAGPAPIRGLPPPPPPREGEDPTWWLPHAVLGALVLIGVLGFFGAFNGILKPLIGRGAAATATATATATAAPASSPAASTPKPAASVPQARGGDRMPVADPNQPVYSAKHLVVQWKGSQRSRQERSKEDAKKRADEALAKIKGGAEFEKVVAEYSDEPGADKTGGKLGRFHARSGFDPKFFAAVEKLKVGEMSEVVESDFGYHVIVRTE